MNTTHNEQETKSSGKQLENLIGIAIKKVGAKHEKEICRYLPGESGGYIHHFTMRKMKNQTPERLAMMISKYIVNAEEPKTVHHKPRAPRGTRKKKDQYVFSKGEVDRLLNIARLAGDKEMVRRLTPKKDLRTMKKELIASIKKGRVEPELWTSYTEAIFHYNSLTAGNSITAPQVISPGV